MSFSLYFIVSLTLTLALLAATKMIIEDSSNAASTVADSLPQSFYALWVHRDLVQEISISLKLVYLARHFPDE